MLGCFFSELHDYRDDTLIIVGQKLFHLQLIRNFINPETRFFIIPPYNVSQPFKNTYLQENYKQKKMNKIGC